MRLSVIVTLLAASACQAQELAQGPLQAPPAQTQETATPQKQTIVVPAGTRIALTLTNQVRGKSSKPGDTVRAVTAFPVTAGTQLAMPVGTYLEGVIDKIKKTGRSGGPGLQMHFTRIVFANGYTVELNGATAEARAGHPGTLPPSASAPAPVDGVVAASALPGQQNSALTPPTLPHVGPSIGLLAGVGAAVVATALVVAVLVGRGHGNYVLFDVGWQFEMVLEAPVTLDADSVAAAIAASSAQ